MVIQLTSQSKSQILAGARVIANAFFDYPLYVHSIPEESRRKSQLHVLFETELTYALKFGFAYATSDRLEGIVYCLPYSTIHISNWQIFRCGAWKIPLKMGFSFVSRQEPIDKVQFALRDKYMDSTSIYLWSIAVDTQFQGKGFGKILLDHLLTSLKKSHQGCYLETVKKANVDIYSRFGFQLLETANVPATSLSVYSMMWKP